MPSTLLLPKLINDYPSFQFKGSDEFRWSPEEKIIYYDEKSDDSATLLHELSHAVLDHTSYLKDIGLLELERDAWEYAQHTLAPTYNIAVTDDTIQDSLDTYRDWLHSRSICPSCNATGIQVRQKEYRCISCGTL